MFKNLLFATLTLTALSSAFAKENPDAYVQKIIKPILTQYQIPGMAIELYINGKLHEYQYGVTNQTTHEPITSKTIFELGSLSHLMTSLLFAQEIDWAKMALQDSVTKYLRDYPNIKEINLQDLATYTSGLPYQLPNHFSNTESLKEYLYNWHADSEPQDEWNYSHLNMALLGLALESSTEKTYAKLYYRHIMLPLQMVNGVDIPKALQKYYAEGYTRDNKPVKPVDAEPFPSVNGVKASVSDMQKFLAAAIGLPGTPIRVFYPMRMTQSVYLKMGSDFQGLGWQIHHFSSYYQTYALKNVVNQIETGPINVSEIYNHPTYDGDALIDKSGSATGFRSYIAVLPNKQSGIVILINKNVPNAAIIKPARDILLTLA